MESILTINHLLYLILGLPLVLSGLAAANVFNNKILHWADRLTATATAGAVGLLALKFDTSKTFHDGFLYLDSLSLWMLLILAVLYVAFSWTSKAYLERDTNIRYGYLRRFSHLEGRFYALSHLFVWTMMLVVLVDNLGLMWVAIEATTLISALLVAFKFTRTSLEAAWKYVMVCTVGICLALLGTILLYDAQLQSLGNQFALDYPYLSQYGAQLPPGIAKIAFAFLFVGYGTKVGLAPMHAWLPDAHSEAPALTSGLLSGALCICALYVLLRAVIVITPAIGVDFVSSLFLFFGLLTIALAVPFVVVQRDIKRMLAYSSMENFGLMAAGFGLFLPLAAKAALLHMMNHALLKYALFYLAGTIMETYATKNMMRIHGMLIQSPRTAFLFLTAVIGILGMPPMGIFFSKFYLVESFFLADHQFLGVLALVLLAGMLIGILYHALRMVGGKPHRKSAGELLGRLDTAIVALLLIGSGMLSACLPEFAKLDQILSTAAEIVMKGVIS